MIAVHACPVCGSREAREMFWVPDLEHPMGGSYPIERCLACGAGYTGLVPSPKRLIDFYESNERRFRYGKTEKAFARIVEILLGFDDPIVEQIPIPSPSSPARLCLDIGSGPGVISTALSRSGWVTVAMDFDSRAAARSTNREYGFVLAMADRLPFRDHSFNLVVVSHLLEHLYRPVPFLDGVRRVLAPGGELLVAVPNLDSTMARLFGPYLLSGYSVPRHLVHFTPHSLRRALESAGFAIHEIRTVPYAMFVGSVLLKAGVARNRIIRNRLFDVLRAMGSPIDIALALRGSGTTLLARASTLDEATL